MQPFEATPAVMGHRGAPVAARENTPASFAAAADAGATWVELDVRRAADHTLVVHHDPHTSDGTPLSMCTADTLAGWGIWLFEAVLESLPPGLGVDVEVKNIPGEPDFDEQEEAAHAVAGLLRPRLGERPWMTSAFNPATVAVLAEALPEVPAGFVHWAGTAMATAGSIAGEHGARVLCPQAGAPDLDAAGVARAHAAGCAVLVWTVDDPGEADRLAAAGVDAICTNDPGALVRHLRSRGADDPDR